MNAYEANKALYQAFVAQWPTLAPGVPYIFDNDVADEQSTYARVRVFDGLSEQHTLGSATLGQRKYARTGVVRVELRAPGNAGRKTLDQLAQHVRTIFEGVRLGATGTEEGVVTFASSTSIGPTDGRHWILAVSTPFEYYEAR